MRVTWNPAKPPTPLRKQQAAVRRAGESELPRGREGDLPSSQFRASGAAEAISVWQWLKPELFNSQIIRH